MTRVATAALVSCVLLVSTACGGESRPTADEWRPRWQATRELVPDAATLEGEDGAELCSEFLGEVREQREDLRPAPNDTIGDAFAAWADKAQSLGLDCVGEATEDLDQRLAKIGQLAERVDRALAAA